MKKLLVNGFIGVALVVCIYPFAWMFFSAFKTNREIYQPTLFFPEDYEWDAFSGLFSGTYLPFLEYFSNSIFISGFQALLATFVTARRFVFTKYLFRGKFCLVWQY